MIVEKWNYKTHRYDKVSLPDDWNIKWYSEDMNMEEIVNCPHCGIEVKFGDTFVSKEFHNFLGFGYAVC